MNKTKVMGSMHGVDKNSGDVWILRYREWDREREIDERLGLNDA